MKDSCKRRKIECDQNKKRKRVEEQSARSRIKTENEEYAKYFEQDHRFLVFLITKGYMNEARELLNQDTFKAFSFEELVYLLKEVIKIKDLSILNEILSKPNVISKGDIFRDLMYFSARYGYVQAFKEILSLQSAQNTLNSQYLKRALRAAIKYHCAEIVDLILGHPKLEEIEDYESIVLLWAVKYKQESTVKKLLSDLYFKEEIMLGKSMNVNMLRELVDEKESVLEKNKQRVSTLKVVTVLLQLAAQNGDLELFKWLLRESGALAGAHAYQYSYNEFDRRDKLISNKNQPLRLAAENGHLGVVNYLLQIEAVLKAEVDILPMLFSVKKLAIGLAIQKGHQHIFDRLLQEKLITAEFEETGEYLLEIAIQFNRLEMFKTLLKYQKVRQSAIANHCAVLNRALEEGVLDFVEVLLAYPDIADQRIIRSSENVFWGTAHCISAVIGGADVLNRFLKIPGIVDELNNLRIEELAEDMCIEENIEGLRLLFGTQKGRQYVQDNFEDMIEDNSVNYKMAYEILSLVEKTNSPEGKWHLFIAALSEGNDELVNQMLSEEESSNWFTTNQAVSKVLHAAISSRSVDFFTALIAGLTDEEVRGCFQVLNADGILSAVFLEQNSDLEIFRSLLSIQVFQVFLTGQNTVLRTALLNENVSSEDIDLLAGTPVIFNAFTDQELVDILKSKRMFSIIERIWASSSENLKNKLLTALAHETGIKKHDDQKKLCLYVLQKESGVEPSMSEEDRNKKASQLVVRAKREGIGLLESQMYIKSVLFRVHHRVVFLKTVLMKDPWFSRYAPMIRDALIQKDLFRRGVEGVENLGLPLEIIWKIFDFCRAHYHYEDALKPIVYRHVQISPVEMMKKLEVASGVLKEDQAVEKAERKSAHLKELVY